MSTYCPHCLCTVYIYWLPVAPILEKEVQKAISTALHCYIGSIGMVSLGALVSALLLTSEVCRAVNEPHACGWTALIVAAESGHTQVVETLISHKADVHVRDGDGH